MKQSTCLLVGTLLASFAFVGVSGLAVAQDKGKDAAATPAAKPGFTRMILQKIDSSAPGREAVQVIGEFDAGAATGKHTHPGEEVGYILEGSFVFEIAGKPPVTLKAGDHFFAPAGTVHEGKNSGTGKAKVLITYIVEKGKPLATPAK